MRQCSAALISAAGTVLRYDRLLGSVQLSVISGCFGKELLLTFTSMNAAPPKITSSPPLWRTLLFSLLVPPCLPYPSPGTNSIPTLDETLAAKQDLWGLAAISQPNGPSYEFFERLLPPLRYVNAAFRHYPIVLSAPGSG